MTSTLKAVLVLLGQLLRVCRIKLLMAVREKDVYFAKLAEQAGRETGDKASLSLPFTRGPFNA